MSRIGEIQWVFPAAVGCFAAHAASYLLMPAAVRTFASGESRGLLLAGCVFWIPLLAGYGLIALANSKRKAFSDGRQDGDIAMQRRMGIVTFFSNTPAVIADSALIAGSIALAILCLCGGTSRYITYVMLAIVSFSLNMHGLFNGRIYRTIKYKQTRRVENHE